MDAARIKFGTDGWRGIIADDFTFDNAALAATAIAQYLDETGQAGKPLLVGYDNRFAADAYAAHLGHHLVSLGWRVLLSAAACPTPVIAFGVLDAQAAGAIMLTASHNPYHYQGLKFIPYFAGPAMPETTDRITALIRELAPGFTPPVLRHEWSGERADFKQAYFDHLDQIVNTGSLAAGKARVLYSAMHGVGAGYLDGYLQRAGVDVTAINTARDVYFGGCLPDPSPANLAKLQPRLVEEDRQVLLATDGDADRFGLMDAQGRYFGANQALPLLADFLVRYKQRRGPLVRTVATSHLLDYVAREHQLELIETPVGFKYVGDELRKGALLGGEESGGISLAGHIPEKDGILASLLMLELSATAGEGFHELLQELMARVGECAYTRVDQHLEDEQKRKLFAALKELPDGKFAGKAVATRNELDGVKLVFADGSWAMLRASGTEPVVRIYLEAGKPEALNKLKSQVLTAVEAIVA